MNKIEMMRTVVVSVQVLIGQGADLNIADKVRLVAYRGGGGRKGDIIPPPDNMKSCQNY